MFDLLCDHLDLFLREFSSLVQKDEHNYESYLFAFGLHGEIKQRIKNHLISCNSCTLMFDWKLDFVDVPDDHRTKFE